METERKDMVDPCFASCMFAENWPAEISVGSGPENGFYGLSDIVSQKNLRKARATTKQLNLFSFERNKSSYGTATTKVQVLR